MKRPLHVFSLDFQNSASFSLRGLSTIFHIIEHRSVDCNDLRMSYNLGFVLIETEYLLLIMKKYSLSWEECILRPEQTIILDLDDSYHSLFLEGEDLRLLLSSVMAYIRREPSFEIYQRLGICTHRIIPTIFSIFEPPAYDWSQPLNEEPFFIGSLTSQIRLKWGGHLFKQLNEKILLKIFYDPSQEFVSHSSIEDHFKDLKYCASVQEKYERAVYYNIIEDRYISVCLSGLGPLTERHLEGLWSGRVIITDDGIVPLSIPFLDFVSGVNCFISSTPEEMVEHILRVQREPSLARRIATNGMKMVHANYQPEEWIKPYRSLLLD